MLVVHYYQRNLDFVLLNFSMLFIFSLNGSLAESGNTARHTSKISLFKRREANGVRPGPVNKVPKARNSVVS